MEDVKNATAWLTRPVWGLATIGILVLLLAVPIGLIRSLIGQRITTRGEAVTEVTRIWGGEQSLIGPKLVIPASMGISVPRSSAGDSSPSRSTRPGSRFAGPSRQVT
jgi:inner membrane protein